MFGSGQPNEPVETVDITRQIDRKIRALRAHVSQHRDPDALEQRVRAWWGSIAVEAGLPDGNFAERFFVADAR
jgi:LmbE family N-acetylglucosaminyl deacetylase